MIGNLYRCSEDDLARLDGDDPYALWELLDRDNPPPLSLEKDWHAIHALLVGAAGDDSGAAGFLLTGGREWHVSGGYGPPRIYDPAETRRIDEFLRDMRDDRFWSTFDASRFAAEDIYPRIWDEPEGELRAALVATFREMREFIAETAASGDLLIFEIA
ncbi:YfbM family protein [Paludisphaera sp.]|uniref:YfbM family protein n=1 Tax=Paludisphaera sp. TaxID=2017432 RepID=UPI00301BDA18